MNVVGKSRKSILEQISTINRDLVVDEKTFMVSERLKPVLPVLNRRKRTLIDILRTARENTLDANTFIRKESEFELRIPDIQVTNLQ